MGQMTINGVSYDVPSGASVSVVNGEVRINGVKAADYPHPANLVVNVTGDVNVLHALGSVTVTGNVGACIEAIGSVSVGGAVNGAVEAGGSVHCGDVAKDVRAGGSVRCGKIGGSVPAGGSVRHG